MNVDVDGVTRVALADALVHAFDEGPQRPGELAAKAVAANAAPPIARLLHSLPDRQFRAIRELWPYLPALPLE